VVRLPAAARHHQLLHNVETSRRQTMHT
jgi:hypothetical protein